MTERAIVQWSGGKDATLALFEVLRTGRCEVAALLSTMDGDRDVQHGLRRSVLRRQARALGLPIDFVDLEPGGRERTSTWAEYCQTHVPPTLERFREYRERGVTAVVSGNILGDRLRPVVGRLLAGIDMVPLWPLDGRDTASVAERFIDLGFSAIVVKGLIEVDKPTATVSERILGREYGRALLSELPADVDPAGERYEFHSFVYDGPLFRHPVEFETGRIRYEDEKDWGRTACLDLA